MATNDSSGPVDEPVEGSWSPKRSKSSAKKADPSPAPDTEQLTQEIDRTREDLAETLDAIAEKVSPKKAVTRTKKKVGNAVKEGANDAVEAVKDTAGGAADAVKGGVAAVKEKVTGDADAPRSPLPPATLAEAGAASPPSQQTVSMPLPDVAPAPVSTTGSLADAASTSFEPAGAETPSYPSALPPAEPSRLPVLAGAGAAVVVLLLLMKRRKR